MKRNLAAATLVLGLTLPAGAQIQAVKAIASLAIPESGLEEIHREVEALTADVTNDVKALDLITAGYPLLVDSIGVMKERAARCGITLQVSIGTSPSLSSAGYPMTVFDEEKYQKSGKVNKMAYLAKVHKALRDEHARYSSQISVADNKIGEILDFLENTDRQVRAAELRLGGSKAGVKGLDDAARVTIRRLSTEYTIRKNVPSAQ